MILVYFYNYDKINFKNSNFLYYIIYFLVFLEKEKAPPSLHFKFLPKHPIINIYIPD
jgi:hypothetical protein